MTNYNSRYGVREDNPILDAAYTSDEVDYSAGQIALSDPRLGRVDRIRLLTEPGCPFFDLSYAWGTLKDGRHVQVNLGEYSFPRKGLKGELIRLAREAGRYAKGLGMLDDHTLSILW